MAFTPSYRLTVYAHKTVDPTEATVLVPLAGAAHSNPFQVTTLKGLTGYQPYMALPEGRRGRIDMLSKKTDVGQFTTKILDAKLGVTDNLTRWVTAFLGDAADLNQFSGCRVFTEENTASVAGTGASGSFTATAAPGWTTNSEVGRRVDLYNGRPDQGGTLVLATTVTSNTTTILSFTGNATGATFAYVWTPFATGWITGQKLVGRLYYEFNARDGAETLKSPCFVSRPHPTASYASPLSLMPLAIVKAYGTALVAPFLDGRTTQRNTTTNTARVEPTNAAKFRVDNIISSNLNQAVNTEYREFMALGFNPLDGTTQRRFTNKARLHLKSGGTEGDFYVGYVHTETHGNGFWSRIFDMIAEAAAAIAIQPMRYPIGVATGTPLVNNVAGYSIGATSIATDGWTISITGILKQGDIISFASHGTRYFVTVDTNSNGSGQSTVVINPPLTASVPDNNAITVQSSPGKMAIPTDGTAITYYIVSDGAPTTENMLLINDVHPVQLWRDILDGYFGWRWNDSDVATGKLLPSNTNLGDPKRKIPYLASAFTTLISDLTLPPFRAIIDKSWPMNKFIEEYICKPYGLAYSINGSGQVVPVDVRHPSTLSGVGTIGNADVAGKESPGWTTDSSAQILSAKGIRYVENITQDSGLARWLSRLGFNGGYPTFSSKALDLQSAETYLLGMGRDGILDDSPYVVDAKGLRAMPKETIGQLFGTTVVSQDRNVWADQVLLRLIAWPGRAYGRGPSTMELLCLRTSNTNDCFPGTLKLIDIDEIPDPATNLRGGSRVGRCVERTEQGLHVKLRFLDLGINTTASTPSLGAPAQTPGDTSHGAQIAVTLNASSQMAEVDYAVTDASVGTKPVDTSGYWTPLNMIFQSMTVPVRNLPASKRVWFRARTFDLLGVQQPSAWVYPTPQFIDLAGLNAPTTLAVPTITGSTAVITWVNVDASLAPVIYLVTPITDPLEYIAVGGPGTTTYTLDGLVSSTQYKVEVRARDGIGGESAGVNTTFTTTGTPRTCPNPGTISVFLAG